MSHNISSSDSEDDSKEAGLEEQTADQHRRAQKFECPADFMPVKYKPHVSTLLNSADTELWLIKAPPRFDPKSLTDLKVSLSGLEMIQSAGPSPQIYSVLGSRTGSSDFQLLTPSGQKKDASPSITAFTGVLSISESYGDCSANQGPFAIPAAPAPSIPPGLRQRFQPFGSTTPAHMVTDAGATTAATTTTTTSSSPEKMTLDSGEPAGHRKKKKKKEKRRLEETDEVMHIKKEVISDFSEPHFPNPVKEEGKLERKLKKKLKKEKERDRSQDEEVYDAGLVKQEPMDTFFSEIDGSLKKKKKEKEKGERQNEVVYDASLVKQEPVDTFSSENDGSVKKKKKKKKRVDE